MHSPSRREFLYGATAVAAGLGRGTGAETERPSLQRQILDRAAELEKQRSEQLRAQLRAMGIDPSV